MKTFLMKVPTRVRFWVCVLLVEVLLLHPAPAKAGVADVLLLLKTVTAIIQNGIGAAIADMRTVENSLNTLHQQIVWPVAAINHTRGFLGRIITQYQEPLNQAKNVTVESATLPTPKRFESALRGPITDGFGKIEPMYLQVYGRVPPSRTAKVQDRNVMDMDDASAVSSLKTAALSDQTSVRMLHLADRIEQQAATSAPGSSTLLAVEAQIASLESQACLEKLFAAELRAEATKLAHENASLKKSAAHSTTLRMNLQQVLK